ncbi:hypothetical protein M3G03_09550 [Aestuariimicrobium sp. p3-SID1156]|uniref:hypothetical protein n=1 Tax=Aestuariimicrobium sp. p3-SID1156 TaxID=2916038 RepID=UPI00223C43C8|nr:hypothetical protein [Aestuariimicrobium sp. p3-SID1156]MCT1459780.1 hypothetical protein [Aestuariimicrobium sp. p3-SID1156]
MSPTVTAVLIVVATAPALGLVWLVAVLAKRQAEQNQRELEADKAAGLLDPQPSDEDHDRLGP